MDAEYINVVLTGKDSSTAGLINIISYDLLTKCMDDLKKKQFRIIIAVSFIIWFLFLKLVSLPSFVTILGLVYICCHYFFSFLREVLVTPCAFLY